MKDFDYQHWLAAAARVTRRRDEAPDLLHDALLEAIRAGRTDFSRDGNRAWFSGVLRNRAAMTARSAVRRKQRETVSTSRKSQSRPTEDEPSARTFIDALPASARTVATLIVAGMNKMEITSVLALTDAAFRQRLTSIRRRWRASDPRDGAPQIACDTRDDVGLIRRALLHRLKWHGENGAIGTHDPDGHLIVLEVSRKSSSQDRSQRQRSRGSIKTEK